METKLAIFQHREIRKTIHENEWWFSVVDICEALTESQNPGAYWRKLKQRLKAEKSEIVTICHALKLKASDGKKYATDCANTEGIFRIIQSIPSPRAEPFKRWLARVGYERIQEIEDPELATKRTRALYKAKGYSEDWIEKRLRGIAICDELTGRGFTRIHADIIKVVEIVFDNQGLKLIVPVLMFLCALVPLWQQCINIPGHRV